MGKVLHTKGIGGGGGTGTGWSGQVEFRGDLPITLGDPAIGDIWLVEKKTTLLGFTTYQSGLYIRDFNTGALSDWRRLNVKVNFTDSEFALVSAADTSKKAMFDLGLLTTSTTRVYTYQDKNYIIAGLDDLAAHGLPTVLSIDNTTGAFDVRISDNQIISDLLANSTINLRNLGVDGQISIEGGGVQLQGGAFFTTDPAVGNITISPAGVGISLFKADFSKIGNILIVNNDLSDVTGGTFIAYPVLLSAQNYDIKTGVVNSDLTGLDIIAKTNNSRYLNQLAYNTGLAGELIVNHTPNAIDFTQTHQAKTGTIALLSDIPTNITAPLPVIVLTSTDNSTTFSQAAPLIIGWDVETYKDSGFSHNNVTNTTRLIVDNDGTYDIGGFLKVFDTDQRSQAEPKILINGVLKDYGLASSYIRGNGASSDEWTLSFNFYPIKLNAGDYVEIQIGVISQITVSFTPTLIGDESFFWIKNLQGTKGETGATGAGSDIIVQKDDVTIGTVTNTLNFEGGISAAIDEGSDKTTLTVEKYYKQTSVNTVGGTINAPYGTPLECVPSSGTLEITVAETGSYIIYGMINIGTDLNKDSGSIELAYGIDTGSGSSVGPQPWRQNQNAKKNKRNGIQGTWGNVNLNAGDKVHLYLSTLGDSTTWEEGEIFIATWK